MFILKKIREFCFNFSTLFGLGEWVFASLIATLIAFPLIFLTRFASNFFPAHYFNYGLFLVFLVYLLMLFLV
ncbi:hypothetical protein GF385_02215, partial [Candidatus Dependentiae bacterium]|nr:hypothetical protein [Candidatus Dependentiae bacterium]